MTKATQVLTLLLTIGLLLGCDAEAPLAVEDARRSDTALSAGESDRADVEVRVLTRNVYHGVDAEIFDVPSASDTDDLLQKVAAVYQGYLDRNFPVRADVLAAEIAATRPHLIGLQEAVLVRTGPAFDPAPATDITLDYVQILLDALAERGLEYEVVVQSIGADIELPSALELDVRHTDREVILKRSDPQSEQVRVTGIQSGNFATNCQIPAALFDPITILRGWVAVDVLMRGEAFRVISTHLDGDCLPVTTAIQEAQAAELLAGPADTPLPLLLIGDLNSPADGTGVTYNTLRAERFGDVWDASQQGLGFTCCQDDHLTNERASLTRRIDYILYRGDMTVRQSIRVGTTPLDPEISDINWASDHAGVYATLGLERAGAASSTRR